MDVGPGRRPLAAPARRVRLHARVAPLAGLKRASRGKIKMSTVVLEIDHIVINVLLSCIQDARRVLEIIRLPEEDDEAELKEIAATVAEERAAIEDGSGRNLLYAFYLNRVTKKVLDLGWVDVHLGCSPSFLGIRKL